MAIEEIWKPVKGYEGLYEVSNLGRVRTLEHYEKAGTRIRIRRSRMKKATLRGRYMGVQLSKDGRNVTYNVHRLVAVAFIDNPNNLPQVNHKDCNPMNNNADNLEWCTALYNVHYADADKKRRASMEWYFKSEECREKMRRVGKANKGRKNHNGNDTN